MFSSSQKKIPSEKGLTVVSERQTKTTSNLFSESGLNVVMRLYQYRFHMVLSIIQVQYFLSSDKFGSYAKIKTRLNFVGGGVFVSILLRVEIRCCIES